MHQSSFSVAGMSTSASSHGHGPSVWTNPGASGSSFTESLAPSKSHYQPGYMMSATQAVIPLQNTQRMDEVPVVQTKAKMNQVLAPDFGMESMFESNRQRQGLIDEDAPPTTSINDLANVAEPSGGSSYARNEQVLRGSTRNRQAVIPITPQATQPIYVIVFGYPPDKYSITVEYFRSLGNATEPEQDNEVINCFRIGYHDSGEAIRAVRKNGELLEGSWMVGVKLADPLKAETVFGLSLSRSNAVIPSLNNLGSGPSNNNGEISDRMQSSPDHSFAVGTPIRLVPSTSAFRKSESGKKNPSIGHVPVATVNVNTPFPSSGALQHKGMLEHVSDLIFGW